MSVILYILIPIGLFILLAVKRKKQQQTACQPPGPQGMPILGNALSLRFDRLELSLFPLAHQYGKILQINILGQTYVVLNDVDTIRKALLDERFRDVFSDKADHFTGKYIMFEYGDIIFGKACERTFTLRKILNKCIRHFGEDKQGTHAEVHQVIAELKNSKGTDVDIERCLRESAGTWFASVVTGRMTDKEDSKAILDFIDALEHFFTAGLGTLLHSFPFVRFLPGKPKQILRAAVLARDKLIERLFDTNTDKLDQFDDAKEPIGLLVEMMKLQERENNKADYNIVDDLKGLGADIFFGVVDTTITAVKHVFVLLLAYPDNVKKIQAEIDEVIGRSREPHLSDKGNMPFLMACLLESQRFTTQAPLGIPHRVTKDIIFEGYNIRKHTPIYINYWFVHHNEKIWVDPWKFRPQRFLDSAGQLLPQDHPLMQALMPFGLGLRHCPGQVLGMNRVFMFVASILQRFNIYPSRTGHVPKTDPRCYKIRISPEVEHYLCRFELRT